MSMNSIDGLFKVLGEGQLRKLVAAFYRRVRKDDLIGPMYPPDDWEGAEERLYLFLAMRFGGPTDYLEKRGHPRLRMRHFPFKIGQAEAERWIDLMDEALDECCIAPGPRAAMHEFFDQVAHFLRNQSA